VIAGFPRRQRAPFPCLGLGVGHEHGIAVHVEQTVGAVMAEAQRALIGGIARLGGSHPPARPHPREKAHGFRLHTARGAACRRETAANKTLPGAPIVDGVGFHHRRHAAIDAQKLVGRRTERLRGRPRDQGNDEGDHAGR